jgi:hypothetical protein
MADPLSLGGRLSYEQFWPRYLRAHGRPLTRALHYTGSLLVLVALATGIATGDWRCFVAMPFIGYGFAWFAHFFVEHNKPETFGHPFWSLWSDYRMLFLWLGGRLAPHLAAARS